MRVPPPLAELQRWMSWAITEPRGPRRALAEPGEAEPRPRLLHAVLDVPPLALADRLAVYADAYFIRLREALAGHFPAVRRELGPERFQRLAADYLLRHPPTSFNIEAAGAALPEFLQGHIFGVERPFLPDLARLERAVLESIHSARRPLLDPDDIRSVPAEAWARARLGLDPSVRLLRVGWPVDRIKRGRLSKAPGPGARRLLIHRGGDRVQTLSVGVGAFLALERISEGKTLEEVCLECADAPVTLWLEKWTRSGVISSVNVGSGPAAAG